MPNKDADSDESLAGDGSGESFVTQPAQRLPLDPGAVAIANADEAALVRIARVHPMADPRGLLPDVAPSRIPRHIAFIMDGNGRWASDRGLPRMVGHRNGASTVRRVIERAVAVGVEFLTMYSFSSENWRRPPEEVAALMELAVLYFEGEREQLVRENIRVRTIGDIEALPDRVRDAIRKTEQATGGCSGLTLCLAINYGARDELVRAARRLVERVGCGELAPNEIDQTWFESCLDTAGLPDPDLLIRTGGDLRVSNFLLWQISYSELYVTDRYWPDFGDADFDGAIRAFAERKRRYGGLTDTRGSDETGT